MTAIRGLVELQAQIKDEEDDFAGIIAKLRAWFDRGAFKALL